MNANKSGIERVEETHASSSRLSTPDKKGDRALALIGDERISLTDEDVSVIDIIMANPLIDILWCLE